MSSGSPQAPELCVSQANDLESGQTDAVDLNVVEDVEVIELPDFRGYEEETLVEMDCPEAPEDASESEGESGSENDSEDERSQQLKYQAALTRTQQKYQKRKGYSVSFSEVGSATEVGAVKVPMKTPTLQSVKSFSHWTVNEKRSTFQLCRYVQQQLRYLLSTTVFGSVWEWIVVMMVAASTTMFIYRSYTYSHDDGREHPVMLVTIVQYVACIVFALDLLINSIISVSVIQYLFSFQGLLDIAAAFPGIPLLLYSDSEPMFSYVSWLPLLKLLTVVNMSTTSEKGNLAFKRLFMLFEPDSWAHYVQNAVVTFAVYILVSTAIFLVIERSFHEQCLTFHESFYFIVVTITTVGYGDFTPVSTLGQLFIVGFVMCSAILLPYQISKLLQVARMNSTYNGKYYRDGKSHIVLLGSVGHSELQLVIRHFRIHSMEIGKSSFNAHNGRTVRLLVLSADRPDTATQKLMRLYNVRWLVGSPLNTRDLVRCKMAHASTVFFFADKRSAMSDDLDSIAVLECMAVRNCNPDVPIFAQVFNGKYLIHMKKAGATHVISLNQFKMNMLAINCISPGFSTMLSNLLAPTFSVTQSSNSARGFGGFLNVKKKKTQRNQIQPDMGYFDTSHAEMGMDSNMTIGQLKDGVKRRFEDYSHGQSYRVFPCVLPYAVSGFDFREAAQKIYENYGCILIGIHPVRTKNTKHTSFGRKSVLLNPYNLPVVMGDIGFILARSYSEVQIVQSWTGGKTRSVTLIPTRDVADSLHQRVQECYNSVEPMQSPQSMGSSYSSMPPRNVRLSEGGQRAPSSDEATMGQMALSFHVWSRRKQSVARPVLHSPHRDGTGSSSLPPPSPTPSSVSDSYSFASEPVYGKSLTAESLSPTGRKVSFSADVTKGVSPVEKHSNFASSPMTISPPAGIFGQSSSSMVGTVPEPAGGKFDALGQHTHLRNDSVKQEQCTFNKIDESIQGHILFCVCGQSVEGLSHFVQPLRLKSTSMDSAEFGKRGQIIPIVVLTEQRLSDDEWGYLSIFPSIYIVQGSARSWVDLKRCNIQMASKVVILGTEEESHSHGNSEIEVMDKTQSQQAVKQQKYMSLLLSRIGDTRVDVRTVMAFMEIVEHFPRPENIIVYCNSTDMIQFLKPAIRSARFHAQVMDRIVPKRATDKHTYSDIFSSGSAILSSTMDTLLLEAYFNPYIVHIAEHLLHNISAMYAQLNPGTASADLHSFGAGQGMEKPESCSVKDKTLHKSHERGIPIIVEDIDELSQGIAYSAVVTEYLSRREPCIPLGLRRYGGDLDGEPPFVYTCPSRNTIIRPGDMIILLKPYFVEDCNADVV